MTMAPSSLYSLKLNLNLNLRDEDCRKTFVAHLDSALSGKENFILLKDDDEKQHESREGIAPKHLMADRESTDAIVIFSNNYASYSSCADELAEIKEEDKKPTGHTASISDIVQFLARRFFKDMEENGSANFNGSTIKFSPPSCALPEAYNLSSISIGSLRFNQQKNAASLRQVFIS